MPTTSTLWRLPILSDGRAGEPEPYLTDQALAAIDDFDLAASGEHALLAEFSEAQIVLVDLASMAPSILATSRDGVSQPTSVAFAPDQPGIAYVTNGAFFSAPGTAGPSLMKLTFSLSATSCSGCRATMGS